MKTVLTEKYNIIESIEVSIFKSCLRETKYKCKAVLDCNHKMIQMYAGKVYINIDSPLLFWKMFEKNGYKVKMNKNNFVIKSNDSNECNVIDYEDYIIEINGYQYSYLLLFKKIYL